MDGRPNKGYTHVLRDMWTLTQRYCPLVWYELTKGNLCTQLDFNQCIASTSVQLIVPDQLQ